MLFKNLSKEAKASKAAFDKVWRTDRNPLGGTSKVRLLYRPNEAMKAVHRQLIEYVRRLREPHISHQIAPFSFPSIANVRVHRRMRYFYLLDLSKAYRHVQVDRLVHVLRSFDPSLRGQEYDAADFLRSYCFADEGGLATGANASPDLFNIYVGKLVDEPLWDLLRAHAERCSDEIRYSRYIDDLTISMARTQIGSSVRWRVGHIIKEAGFPLNRRKVSPSLDLHKGPITITGLRLEKRGRIFVPRHYVRMFRKRMRSAISERRFDGDLHIDKIAGIRGAVWGGTDHERDHTALEKEVHQLWEEYRKLQRLFLQQKNS